MLNEGDMERVEDRIGSIIPNTVCLGMQHIANECAGGGALKDLWVVSVDQGEHTATNFLKMAERGDPVVPQLKRGFIIIGRCDGEIAQVCHCEAEFVPKQSRGIAR